MVARTPVEEQVVYLRAALGDCNDNFQTEGHGTADSDIFRLLWQLILQETVLLAGILYFPSNMLCPKLGLLSFVFQHAKVY